MSKLNHKMKNGRKFYTIDMKAGAISTDVIDKDFIPLLTDDPKKCETKTSTVGLTRMMEKNEIDREYKAPFYQTYNLTLFKHIMSGETTLYNKKEIDELIGKLAYFIYYDQHCNLMAADSNLSMGKFKVDLEAIKKEMLKEARIEAGGNVEESDDSEETENMMQIVKKVKREPVLTEAVCQRIHKICDELLQEYIKSGLGAVKPDLIVKNKK
jgi:hypothetical protein